MYTQVLKRAFKQYCCTTYSIYTSCHMTKNNFPEQYDNSVKETLSAVAGGTTVKTAHRLLSETTKSKPEK